MGESTANGAGIQQYDYLGGANQQWHLIAVDDVHYQIVNRLSGNFWTFPADQLQTEPLSSSGGYFAIFNSLTRKALEVSGTSDADGALIDQSDFASGANQLWQLVIAPNLPVIYSPIYLIISKQSGKVLDDPNSSFANGTLMQQWNDLEGCNQQWYLIPTGN